jgi:hypothetical protein
MKSLLSRSLFPVIAITAAALPLAAGTQDGKTVVMDKVTVESTKTHTLFMGADISVGQERDLYAVKDVVGSSWVIQVGGQQRVVSTKSGPLNIRITPALKLTEVSATIGDLKSVRGYTEANDPEVLMTRSLAQTAVQNADYNASMNQATAAQNGAMAATQMGINRNTTGGPGSPAPGMQAAALTNALHSAQQTVNTAAGGVGADYSMGGREVRSQGFDGVDVEFEISSPRPLHNPYVVTMTKFHPAGTKEGTVQNLVYAKSLDPIDSRPTKVHFVEGGFPFNFDLVDFQLHVYNQGAEIATNVSSKRVELTRDEAFEYVKMEYMGAHKGETLPATAAMGKLPADLPARLANGQYGNTFYVRVSKDGLADEAFTDTACTKRIADPYIESIVKGIRFKPSLEQGKPVEGTAAVNLGQLAI